MSVLTSGAEFGLLNSLMVAGLALALRFASFPDLTIEGTISIGAAVSALAVAAGFHPIISVLFGGLVGAAAGCMTAVLHLVTGMSRLLASIIMMTALYAITLRIMQGSNMPLFDYQTWYTSSPNWYMRCVRSAIIVVPALVLLVIFLHTEFGLLLRATGENWTLVRKLGKPCWLYLLTTLAIANSLVGVSGAMIAQYNKFADVGFGTGTIVTGLAALLIGETILVPTSVGRQIGAAVLGSLVYSTIFSLALRLGLHPWDLKLASATIVLVAIAFSKLFSRQTENRRVGCDPL